MYWKGASSFWNLQYVLQLVYICEASKEEKQKRNHLTLWNQPVIKGDIAY